MLSHVNLMLYYQNIFGLAQHHKYSIQDVENLYPFEREVYVSMLINYLEEVKQKIEKK